MDMQCFDFDKALMLAKESCSVESNSIGMLAEKTLHSTLKFMFDNDISHHEQKFAGFVADVLTEKDCIPFIYEIQTRQTFKLARKLTAYEGKCNVCVVLPVIKEKKVVWKEPMGGILSAPHKSSRPKNVFSKVAELYALKNFLGKEYISYCFPVLAATEYKLLDGWDKTKKKGATKIDTVPERLIENVVLKSREDFYELLPYQSGDTFTANDMAKVTGLSVADARYVILVYKQLEIVEETAKTDRKKVWKVIY